MINQVLQAYHIVTLDTISTLTKLEHNMRITINADTKSTACHIKLLTINYIKR